MHLRTVFLLLLFVLCSVFLVVNWEGVMANVNVNLLYTEIQAPLGLILLLGPGLVILICLVYGFVQQAALSMELRRVNKQLQQARDLAQKAEQSQETVNSLSASVGEVEDRLSQLVEMAAGKDISIGEKKIEDTTKEK